MSDSEANALRQQILELVTGYYMKGHTPEPFVPGELIAKFHPMPSRKLLLERRMFFVIDAAEQMFFLTSKKHIAQRLVQPGVTCSFLTQKFDKMGQNFFDDLSFDIFHRIEIIIDGPRRCVQLTCNGAGRKALPALFAHNLEGGFYYVLLAEALSGRHVC